MVLHHHGPLQMTDHALLLSNQILSITPPPLAHVLAIHTQQQLLSRPLASRAQSLRLHLHRPVATPLHAQLLLALHQVRKQVVTATAVLFHLLHYS